VGIGHFFEQFAHQDLHIVADGSLCVHICQIISYHGTHVTHLMLMRCICESCAQVCMQFANFRHAWPHLRHFHRFWHVLGACAFWIAVCAFMARLSAFFPYMCALMGKLPKHAAQFDQVCQGSAHFDKFVGILQHRVFISGICAHCETTPYVFVTLGLILAAQLLVLIFSGILFLVWGALSHIGVFILNRNQNRK
jgi:hypothetical protein